ncbi:Glutamate receptor ionotropic, delta-1 [Araneus ventricosus]|uniref:Glutamate receptor ionotropic, delta-1 n=1 Tax=Araneus ventricosus TaxID=182803 RepID=A0A4Y2CXZ2_ARAVE|nr:Glutamate receptor ionotropic, delta-1 [Araneus ventricosus]
MVKNVFLLVIPLCFFLNYRKYCNVLYDSYCQITPIFELEEREDGSLYGVGGSEFPVLEILSKYMPFSYELLIRKDYVFGNAQPNGEWTGMMGMLQRKEVDMAIGWVACSYKRQTIVDFSFPHIITADVFVTAAPKTLRREFPFLSPFQFLVWMILLTTLVCSGLALSALDIDRSGKVVKNFFKRWLAEIGRLAALFIGQGRYDRYQSGKVRAFMYLWSISKLILVFGYSTDLLAYLTVPVNETPLQTVQELRDAVVAGKYQFGLFKGVSHVDGLMGLKSGVLKDLADHIRNHPENRIASFEESIARIEAGNFAMMNMRLHFLYSAGRIGLEKFYMSRDSIGHNMVSVAFKKGFEHMEKINRIIIRMGECGITRKITKEMLFSARLKAPTLEHTDRNHSLTLSDLKTALWLVVSGEVLAVLCFALEIAIHRLQKNER